MPCGLCHITARNLESVRAKVPASDVSWVVKWVRKNNFHVPCIYLEVQKLCCLHYNVLLTSQAWNPIQHLYLHPILKLLWLRDSSLMWPVMWGQERSQYSTSKNGKDTKTGCMVDGKGLFSPCNSGSLIPVLFCDTAKTIPFSPKHKGVCELPVSRTPTHRIHAAKGKMPFLHCITPNRLLK